MNHPDLRMDLNLFRVLDAIYTQGGISAAARSLHLTQPAITHSLNRLRELFGDPLFVRQGNRVIPTEKTRAVMDEVQQHLTGLLATTRMQPAFRPDQLEREFRVGFRDVLESIAFPSLMTRLGTLAPKVRLFSRRMLPGSLNRELSSGGLDLVIDRRLPTGAQVSSQHLLDESLVVLMRRDHPLDNAPLRRSDYLAARHVAVSQLGETAPLDVLLGQDGRSRTIELVCQHYFSACQVVVATDLLLTLPSSYASNLAPLLALVRQPLPMRVKPIPIFAYWHASRDRDPSHEWFRQLLIDAIRNAPEFRGR